MNISKTFVLREMFLVNHVPKDCRVVLVCLMVFMPILEHLGQIVISDASITEHLWWNSVPVVTLIPEPDSVKSM